MKPIFQLLFFLLIALFLFSCEGESPIPVPEISLSETEQATLDLLKTEITPISNSPLDISYADLTVLDRLGVIKMVALGEATHGTREFF